jgi:RNA polymerase sigma-70 factor (ECF subfamily)
MDDLQAIRRLKNGDIGGLEFLIARYQAKAVRTAYLVTHDEPMAEDVVQDAFVRFYERIRHFDAERAFEPYFLRMVVNAALNAVERESRTAAPLDDDAGMRDAGLRVLEGLIARADTVEEQVELALLKREIHQALGKLTPRQRVAVVQRYYLDMSEHEMSEALDATPWTVKWLLHSARARLRALLGWQRSEE